MNDHVISFSTISAFGEKDVSFRIVE